jgi:hypothetical protein
MEVSSASGAVRDPKFLMIPEAINEAEDLIPVNSFLIEYGTGNHM